MAEKNQGTGPDLIRTTYLNYEFNNPKLLGKLMQQINPDGSWTGYEYRDDGYVTAVTNGFKNAATNADSSACRITRYTYDPLDRQLDDGTRLPVKPRMITEFIADNTNSVTAYIIMSDYSIIESRYANPSNPNPNDYWNDSANLFMTNFYDSNWQLQRIVLPNHTLTTYAYSTNTPQKAMGSKPYY